MQAHSSQTHLVPRSLCEHASKKGVHVTSVHSCAVLLDTLHVAKDEGLQQKGISILTEADSQHMYQQASMSAQRRAAPNGWHRHCEMEGSQQRSVGEGPKNLMQDDACQWQPPHLHMFRSLAGDACHKYMSHLHSPHHNNVAHKH